MGYKNNGPVVIWLIVGVVLVASMVIIGGITRLTHSGLSMVDWKLIVGAIPPLSESEWQETFTQYKQFPEFQKINTDFSLQDFKSIFWWEYIHRLLGRLIGLVFIIPFLVFLIQRRFNRSMIIKLLILLAMGAFQGFMGWYMVKSGLVNEPSVSHFRLAAHLVTAFIVCAYISWIVLDITATKISNITVPTLPAALKFLLFLVLLQITYGAFVAGLKAGYFYPTFPKMGSEWIPLRIAESYAISGWHSLINDLTTVQFIHRWLGILATFTVLGIHITYRPSIPQTGRNVFDGLLWIIILQVTLGIFTLIFGVPIVIAVSHQILALLVLLMVVWNIHQFRQKYQTISL